MNYMSWDILDRIADIKPGAVITHKALNAMGLKYMDKNELRHMADASRHDGLIKLTAEETQKILDLYPLGHDYEGD